MLILSEYNKQRLELLEQLVYDPTHERVIVLSTVDPLYFLTEGFPEVLASKERSGDARLLLDRWARVLGRLAKVRLPEETDRESWQQKVRAIILNRGGPLRVVEWIVKECAATPFLREIGCQLAQQIALQGEVSCEFVERAVLERANAYYHVVWSSLAASERLVLYQLALDGWANPKNMAALEQLERKQLIRRDPMYKVLNESFREFIASNEHADEISEWEKREAQSTWHVLRVALLAAAIGAGVWLLYSQSALFQAGTAYIAGIATLLTAIASLFGRLKRATPSDASGPPESS
jgi:hypothetical protein